MPENQLGSSESLGRKKGERAEEVAAWYFRLNGFFSIPGFVVHLDTSDPRSNENGDAIRARTEADLMAVRFPHSQEVIARRPMTDHQPLVSRGLVNGSSRPLFVLVEVKASVCRMNGPWTNRSAKNMQRVIRRFGVTPHEALIDEAAEALYETARWEGTRTVIQYVCVGAQKNEEIQNKYPSLLQIDWDEIGDFLYTRFNDFPEKMPGGLVHEQWPEFGRTYGRWFQQYRKSVTSQKSRRAVRDFVDTGILNPMR